MPDIQHADDYLMRRMATRFYRRARAWGRLVPPGACEKCGAEGAVVGHHPRYGAPLAVQWVCRPCHLKIHRGFVN